MKRTKFLSLVCAFSGSIVVGCSGMLDTYYFDAAEARCRYMRDQSGSEYESQMSCVNFVISRGLSPDTRDLNGEPVLIKAARCGAVAAVKKLLEAGADVEAKNNGGDTALHTAVFWGRWDVVMTLLNALPSPDAKNKAKSIALIEAVRWDKHGLIASLLAIGADNSQKDRSGYTAFDLALKVKNEKAFAVLLAALLRELWTNGPFELSEMIADYCDCSTVEREEPAAEEPAQDSDLDRLSDMMARCSVM